MMRIKKKTLMRVVIGLAALGASGYFIVLALKPSPVKVESAGIQYGLLQGTIDAEGKTRASDRFIVAAPVTGKLSRSRLRRGDTVKYREIIARIEPPPLAPLDARQLAESQARVVTAEQLKREAEAGVELTRAELEQATREITRAEKLVETGDISRQEFERARIAGQTISQKLEAARFKARAAASEVEVARAAMLAIEASTRSGAASAVLVRSPINGRVLRVPEESERVVTAGAPLLELSSPSLEIVIDLLSTDAVKVKPGMPVLIEGWGGDPTLHARVRMIEPSAFTKVSALGIEEQRVNAIADFIDANPPLGDGYRIEARIVIYEAAKALKAPSGALFRTGQEWAVFVIENGVAKRRSVEIGHRAAFEVEILNGLREGEIVIVHPSNLIDDGVMVTNQ